MEQTDSQLFDQTTEQKAFKDRLKLTLSGLSGAFMLPISTLAIVSFFLVLGGFISSLDSTTSGAAHRVGIFIRSFAYPILQTIPLLFCVAFAFSFCKGDPTYIWGAVIAYLAFLSVQGSFISGSSSSGYTVLFDAPGRRGATMKGLVDNTLGFRSLNTSIFGSLMIGGVMMPYIQKHYGNVNLPGPFAFFSGKRFIPLISVVGSFFMAMLFLVFWPWIGTGFAWFGNNVSKAHGVDSFIFGFLEKALIPTGLHHMFYSPFWFSSVGGDAISLLKSDTSSSLSSSLSSSNIEEIKNIVTSTSTLLPSAMWQGDSFLGATIVSLPGNKLGSDSKQLFDYFAEKGLHIGRYTQGKYPVMQFGLPAAALGMSFASSNTKKTLKMFAPGILSSFLLGITEPLEFTFLFAMPKLFYCFHAPMCGLSFLLMYLLGAHIPSIFSGGFVEFLFLGVIPGAKGTKFWWYLLVGAGILAPLYWMVFYTAVKRFNLPTPAIEEDTDVSESTESQSKVPEATRKLAKSLGGWENIEKLSNCASRLRYDIVDKNKVNEADLKAAGALAIIWVGDNHLQIVVGPKAEGINNDMLKWKGESLD